MGQGDAILVQGRTASVLVDAGGAYPGGDLGRTAVVPALRALGVRRLDLVVATHADRDHRGGLPVVLRAVPVGALWLPPGERSAFAELVATASARRVPVWERGAGSPAVRLGDLRVTPLGPLPALRGAERNDRSLVVRIETAGRRVLLPGDVSARAEAALVASGADLAADVLLLPHHGSRTSSSAAFLAAVGASVVVASAPERSRFGMPHAGVRERAARAGASLWWTGRDGAVLVGLGERLWVRGFRPTR